VVRGFVPVEGLGLMDEHIVPSTKRCSKCGVEYPATREWFQLDNSRRDGFRERCKKCQSIVDKERYNTQPEYRQRKIEKAKQYYSGHKEHKKQYDQERSKKPEIKEKQLQRSRKRGLDASYQEKRRQRSNLHARTVEGKTQARKRKLNRRAREYELPNTLSTVDIDRMMKYWGGCCAACGKSSDFWTVIAYDHWIPVTDPNCPGTVPTNIIPLCHKRRGAPTGYPSCNPTKSDRNPREWLIDRFGKRKAKQIEQRIQSYFDWLRSLRDNLADDITK
jgi:hypothetical protein